MEIEPRKREKWQSLPPRVPIEVINERSSASHRVEKL